MTTFVRAKERRRYVRGTIADRKARGWQIVREGIRRMYDPDNLPGGFAAAVVRRLHADPDYKPRRGP